MLEQLDEERKCIFVIVKFLLPKDTKSLGNKKAPACESRGFVRKRKKGCILTHLLFS